MTAIEGVTGAARQALERAGVDARQIDCVIVATVSHMFQTPAIATAISDRKSVV